VPLGRKLAEESVQIPLQELHHGKWIRSLPRNIHLAQLTSPRIDLSKDALVDGLQVCLIEVSTDGIDSETDERFQRSRSLKLTELPLVGEAGQITKDSVRRVEMWIDNVWIVSHSAQRAASIWASISAFIVAKSISPRAN